MTLDNSSSAEVAEILIRLTGDLDDACEMTEMGRETPLENLSVFKELSGHETEMMETIDEYFGVNTSSPQVVREYETQGTPDSPGEGTIKVSVIATNKPEIFLGKWTYADGTVVWTIRPFEVDGE